MINTTQVWLRIGCHAPITVLHLPPYHPIPDQILGYCNSAISAYAMRDE